MRKFLDIITESADNVAKIDRSAFLYLPPKPPDAQFAQCATCVHFIPDQRCGIFADSDRVTAHASCGFYLHGDPSDTECKSIVTPKQAGYVADEVRCENCSWHDNGDCGLYSLLVQRLPDVFDFGGASVDQNGCCNAWQKK